MMAQFDKLRTLYAFLHHRHVGRDEIVAFQNKRLRSLVAHAYENVPYYRKLFDRNGLKPQDIKTVDDLSAIPITSKKDLQSVPPREVVARGVDPEHLIVHATSGSSGEPSIIRRTWLEERLLGAFRVRAMHYLGLRMRDKTAIIVLTRPTQPRDNQLALQTLQALGLYRNVRIDCRSSPQEIVSALQDYLPSCLCGFPNVLSRCAQMLADNNDISVRPRFVVTRSEVLTPLMQHQIVEGFRAPVFEGYGSHEFNLIAWECKQTGELHTCDDSMIVEVLRNGVSAKEGERGEVVGTGLHSFAMPFIRFRLGDVVTKGSETCSCGHPYSTIRKVQGRMIDYFPLPGGRLIHPYEIVALLLDDVVPVIRQYQLVQERADRIILRAVPSNTFSAQRLTSIEKSVKTLLGPDVEFRVALVPDIDPETSGKFRVSRSLVHSAYDGIDWNHA
jgi:phenylacetate-CoA ligase